MRLSACNTNMPGNPSQDNAKCTVKDWNLLSFHYHYSTIILLLHKGSPRNKILGHRQLVPTVQMFSGTDVQKK